MEFSKLVLRIQLSSLDDGEIRYRDANNREWTNSPDNIDESWRVDRIWVEINNAWDRSRDILLRRGAEIGGWLFDNRAQDLLSAAVQDRHDGESKLRIELEIPKEFVEIPWEIAAIKGINHLAVDRNFTVVRVISEHGDSPELTRDYLSVLLCGVDTEHDDSFAQLRTADEIASVNGELTALARTRKLDVDFDVEGRWHGLVKDFEHRGPPDIFHFAGHGLPDGQGLVFQGEDGQAFGAHPAMLANLFGTQRNGRSVRLAFLNACSTSAGSFSEAQPFGGLSHMLIQNGVPIVVGLQTPVRNGEARRMATIFYKGLVRGKTADCALQQARQDMFMSEAQGVGWAFLNMTIRGEPAPLLNVVGNDEEAPLPPVLKFGHTNQRAQLEILLGAERPFVIVVHGEQHHGHRHVMKRLRHDLEGDGRILWRPVAEARLNLAIEPELLEGELAAAIAEALDLDTDGDVADVVNGIIEALVRRCSEGNVVVVDVTEIVTAQSEMELNALRDLVFKLWASIMARARKETSKLPVYLLLGIGYESTDPDHPTDQGARIFVEELSKVRMVDKESQLRVRVLPELEQIEINYVIDFLDTAVNLNPDLAEKKAYDMVGDGQNNVEVLKEMERYLKELVDG